MTGNGIQVRLVGRAENYQLQVVSFDEYCIGRQGPLSTVGHGSPHFQILARHALHPM